MKNCLNCKYGHPVMMLTEEGWMTRYRCLKTDTPQYYIKPIDKCKFYIKKVFINGEKD